MNESPISSLARRLRRRRELPGAGGGDSERRRGPPRPARRPCRVGRPLRARRALVAGLLRTPVGAPRRPPRSRCRLRIAHHYRERGDTGRAVGLLERLLAREAANLPWLEAYVEILVEDGAEPRAEEAVARAVQHGLPGSAAAALRRVAQAGGRRRRGSGGRPPRRAQPDPQRRRLRAVLHALLRPRGRPCAAMGPQGG